MRTSSEPLDHLDKPILQLKMHKHFDNLTKEFDIALIKFDNKGIEFEVSREYILKLSADLSFAASHPADLSAAIRR